MKKINTHTDPKKPGLGDYYGTGVRNPVGKSLMIYPDFPAVPKKDLGKKPKSLA